MQSGHFPEKSSLLGTINQITKRKGELRRLIDLVSDHYGGDTPENKNESVTIHSSFKTIESS
jgi:hypothetical protein